LIDLFSLGMFLINLRIVLALGRTEANSNFNRGTRRGEGFDGVPTPLDFRSVKEQRHKSTTALSLLYKMTPFLLVMTSNYVI